MSDIPGAEELLVQPEQQSIFRLGVVEELFDNGAAKVKFDGEETTSEKQYAYLSYYKPTVGDRVLLAAISGTYVILGNILYNQSPPETDPPSGDITVDDITINGKLSHMGGMLGFFGATPKVRWSIRSNQGTDTAVNDLLAALVAYGLIETR